MILHAIFENSTPITPPYIYIKCRPNIYLLDLHINASENPSIEKCMLTSILVALSSICVKSTTRVELQSHNDQDRKPAFAT